MDNLCTQINTIQEQIVDTDQKAKLEEILSILGCQIVEPILTQQRSGGAGTTDPDQD